MTCNNTFHEIFLLKFFIISYWVLHGQPIVKFSTWLSKEQLQHTDKWNPRYAIPTFPSQSILYSHVLPSLFSFIFILFLSVCGHFCLLTNVFLFFFKTVIVIQISPVVLYLNICRIDASKSNLFLIKHFA